MIQSALEALQQIEDKQRPISLTSNETASTSAPVPIFSEAVTSALTAWISQQNSSMSTNSTPLVSPPPSTPLDASTEVPCRPISASDLITALSSLIPPPPTVQDSKNNSLHRERVDDSKKGREISREDGDLPSSNSNPCTVPSTTPQEGLEEWYKLGIRPEEVIQALSALTIQEQQRVKMEEQSSFLSPITEGRPALTVTMAETQEREEGEGECTGTETRVGNSPLVGEEVQYGGEVVGQKGGGGEGDGDGLRGELLSWDPADITEITINRQITTTDSLIETMTSIDEAGSNGLPSDTTDSDNPVFSPELSYPSSPLATLTPSRDGEGEGGREGELP